MLTTPCLALLAFTPLLACAASQEMPAVIGVESRTNGLLVCLSQRSDDAALLEPSHWTISTGTVEGVERAPNGYQYFLKTDKPIAGQATITTPSGINTNASLVASNRPGPDFASGRNIADSKLHRTPPPNAIQLWTGNGTEHLIMKNTGGPVTWSQDGEALRVKQGAGDVISRVGHGSGRYHIEWRSPSGGGDGNSQLNGNSGVKFDSRYEVQILNTPGGDHVIKHNEAGAIYRIKAPDTNASLGPDKWQTYDVWFTAPKWSNEHKIADARMTLYWNGVLVHDDVLVPSKTGASIDEGPESMPFLLQAHGSSANGDVQFRNVWFAPLQKAATSIKGEGTP
jgi:hypothetical protein